MLRRTRHRLQVAALAIFCLLFQQMALAAYLCPAEEVMVEALEMPADCAEMGMDLSGLAPDNPALCQQHCSPDHSVAADAVKLTVPPLALPAQAAGAMHVQSACNEVARVEIPISRSDPPPRLRFCSLLI